MAAFSLVHLAILLAALALVVAVTGFGVRGWRRRGTSPIVGLTFSGAVFFAGLSLLLGTLAVIDVLWARTTRFTIPVAEFWPQLPDGVTILSGPTATIAGGGFTSADVDVTGASTTARIVSAFGQGLDYLVPMAIAVLIAIACYQLIHGAAFARVVVRSTLITAVVVIVGGVAAQVLSQVAGSYVAHELLTVTAASGLGSDDDLTSLLPQAASSVTITFWPIGTGIALAALAAIFKYGARLQRDTEGLV